MKPGYYILVIALLASGCSMIDRLSPGETQIRQHQIANTIEEISINAMFEIVLIQDSKAYVEIICGENFQPKIDISAVDNQLNLNHSIKNRWLHGYDKVKLRIHLPRVTAINIRTPSKVETEGMLNTETLTLTDWSDYSECNITVNTSKFSLHTSGDSFGIYRINGQSKGTEIYSRGSATINCTNLQAESCNLYHKSIMDLPVNVSHKLDVTILASGNVYYSGNPTISLTRNGSGNLIRNE